MRLPDARVRFLVQLRADGRSDHTIDQYERHLRVLEGWLQRQDLAEDIARITHEDIAQFLASDDVTRQADGRLRHARTTNAIRTSTRGFFRYLHQAGVAAADPTRLSRQAILGPPAPKALDDDEQGALLRALWDDDSPAGQRDRVLFTVLLRTGIRIGSALALEVADVDVRRGEITLRRAKGGREDILPVADAVRDLLAGWVGDRRAGPVFPGRDGAPLTRRHVARRLDAALKRGGIDRPASPHTLRHSFATRLYRRTGDIALVQAALTHRNIESTLVYARPDRDRLRAAL